MTATVAFGMMAVMATNPMPAAAVRAEQGGQPMDVIEQLEIILPALQERIARVPVENLDEPTPCSAFRIRHLLDHLIGGASAFAPQLRGDDRPGESPAPTDETRPAAAIAAIDELLAALKSPGAFERTVRLPFGAVPGEVLARFLTVDGMVHTWDLARATGTPYDPPAELTVSVLASARELISPELRDGDTFADEVAVPADASPLIQLVAFTGRALWDRP